MRVDIHAFTVMEIFPLQIQFQCGKISRGQAICLHGMARQNFIRQFVTILSLNKTRDIKTEGFCTGSLWRKSRFSVWARSACFFYAQTRTEEISCSSGARVARRVGEDKLSYSIAHRHPSEICQQKLTGAQRTSRGR